MSEGGFGLHFGLNFGMASGAVAPDPPPLLAPSVVFSEHYASATSALLPTPGLTAGRDGLLFIYFPSATTSIVSITDQANVTFAPPNIENLEDMASSAAHIYARRIRVPGTPFTGIRVTLNAARVMELIFVELVDSDLDEPTETAAAFGEVITSAAPTSFTIGPTPTGTSVPGALAFAFMGLHNNSGGFLPWTAGFTQLAAEDRVSLATRTTNSGGPISATANWTNPLLGVGLIVIARPLVVNSPPVVLPIANASGVAVDAVVTRTASATDADADTLTWLWTLEQKPVASALDSDDIVGRTTASIAFAPDEPTGGTPYVLRATASDGEDTGYAEFSISVPPTPTTSIPFFGQFNGVLVELSFGGQSPPIPTSSHVLLENGNVLVTESGDPLTLES